MLIKVCQFIGECPACKNCLVLFQGPGSGPTRFSPKMYVYVCCLWNPNMMQVQLELKLVIVKEIIGPLQQHVEAHTLKHYTSIETAQIPNKSLRGSGMFIFIYIYIYVYTHTYIYIHNYIYIYIYVYRTHITLCLYNYIFKAERGLGRQRA